MAKHNNRIPIWHRSPWKWLFSLRVGLVLLAVLVAASIFGTLIEPLERAQELVYYSWWYKALLLLVAVFIGLSTIRTIAEKVIPLRRPRFQREPKFYQAIQPSAIIAYDGDAQSVAGALSHRGFRVFTDGNYGYARKGIFSRYGAPISHLGIVIVLLAGFVSSWFAREGVVQLTEGEQTDYVTLTTSPPVNVPLGFTLRVDDFNTEFFPKTRIPSTFISTVTILESGREPITGAVEVNHTMKIRGWTIHQTSYEEVSSQPRYRLAVGNADLATTLSLDLSPGQTRALPRSKGAEITLQRGVPLQWTIVQSGQPRSEGVLTTAVGSVRVRAERFEPDFVMGPDRKVASRSQDMNNPALQVMVSEDGRIVAKPWLFLRADLKAMMHSAMGPYDLELLDISGQPPALRFHIAATRTGGKESVGDFVLSLGEEAAIGSSGAGEVSGAQSKRAENGAGGEWNVKLIDRVPAYATTLTLTRNPVIPIVYAGCAIVMIGLLIVFFIRRKEVWFWVDANRKRLHVAAIYRHARESLDPATSAALTSLKHKEETRETGV